MIDGQIYRVALGSSDAITLDQLASARVPAVLRQDHAQRHVRVVRAGGRARRRLRAGAVDAARARGVRAEEQDVKPTIEVRPDPTVDEIKAALAAMQPWDRHDVLKRAGMDPGPRTWTRTGRKLGVPQCDGGDGHIFADWPDEVRRTHRVYFVQAGDPDADGSAAIKIGFTTDLDQRLRQLQTAHPEPLKIVERVIGTQAIEAFFHRLLREERIRGEWYRLGSDDIAEATVRLYEAGLWSW